MRAKAKPAFKRGDKVEHVFSLRAGTVTRATRTMVTVLTTEGRTEQWRAGSTIKATPNTPTQP